MRKYLFIFATLVLNWSARAAAPVVDIPNLHQVTPGIERGGWPQSDIDFTFLASQGIKTIIDLEGGDLDNPGLTSIITRLEPGETPQSIAAESARAAGQHMAFFNIPLNSLAPITAAEDSSIDQILVLIADPANQPLFVHCQHGVDRTGLIIALYRVRSQGWTPDAAYQEWEKLGHKTVGHIVTGSLDDYFYKKVQQY